MSQNRWQLIPNNTLVSCSKKKLSIKGVIVSQRLRALILKVHLPRFLCLICLWLSWRSMSASTHHLYDPGFLPRSLLLGDDVLGQNYAAEQGADAGAGRCSNLHHGRPVHGGPLLLQTNRRPESPVRSCLLFASAFLLVHARSRRSSMLRENTHSVEISFLAAGLTARQKITPHYCKHIILLL